MDKVILASASPRRKELLKLIFDEFEIIPTNCDESIPENSDVHDVPAIIAERKAMALNENSCRNALVISCDTVVAIDNMILGKPVDKQDAFRMMSVLSGKTHEVISGVCILYKGQKYTFSQISKVTFYPLSDEEIFRYIESDEPYDKAGGYGIQGEASLFVESIEGDYFNIVGLPVARLARQIKEILSQA